MHCLNCRGPLEYAQEVKFARCTHCLSLFTVNHQGANRWLTPLEVRAPNGQADPAFTAMYAQQLGFAPRQQSHQVMSVGGAQVKVDTRRLEREVRNKISGWIWGLVIGAFILVLIAGVFGWAIWMAVKASNETASGGGGGGGGGTTTTAAKTATWDGKAPYSCSGNDNVKIEKVTAKLTSGTAISASGNCKVTLVDCDITAPTVIEASANAQVTVQGGKVDGSTNSAVASAAAKVDFQGTTVKGATKSSGAAKITGAK